MPHVLNILLLGGGIAFLACIPAGPINFTIVQSTLIRGKTSGLLLAIGATVCEVLICLAALYSVEFVQNQSEILSLAYLFAVPVFIFIGVMMILKRHRKPRLKLSAHNDLLKGFAMGMSNPGIFFFWLSITVALQENGIMVSGDRDYLAFAGGVLIGLAGFFLVLTLLTARFQRKLSERAYTKINLVIGLLFIAFGIFTLFVYLYKYVF